MTTVEEWEELNGRTFPDNAAVWVHSYENGKPVLGGGYTLELYGQAKQAESEIQYADPSVTIKCCVVETGAACPGSPMRRLAVGGSQAAAGIG
jgi:hypothetical protein